MTTTTQEKSKVKGEASRAMLQQGALEIIAESGCSSVTMVNLGKRCNVSRGLPQHHFGTRHKLFLSLFERSTELLKSFKENPPWGDKTGLGAICRVIDNNIKRIQENPLLVRGQNVLVNEGAVCEKLGLKEEVRKYNQAGRAFLVTHIKQELSDLPHEEADRLAGVLQATQRGLFSMWAADPDSKDIIAELEMLKNIVRTIFKDQQARKHPE